MADQGGPSPPPGPIHCVGKGEPATSWPIQDIQGCYPGSQVWY